MNQYFNLKRFKSLFVREILINKKNLIIMFFSLILLFLLFDFSLLNEFFEKRYSLQHYQIYPIVVLIYCLVVTSTSFVELNSSEREIDFFMLPASMEEKFTVKFFYTTLVFVVLSIASLSVAALVVELVRSILQSDILFRKIFHSYTPWMLLYYINIYLALHSLFFLGAIYFKKMEFGKTLLFIVVLLALAGVYLLILNYLPFYKNTITRQEILEQFGVVQTQLSNRSARSHYQFFYGLKKTLLFLFLYIIPFILWGIAYFRFKEEEVDNGI